MDAVHPIKFRESPKKALFYALFVALPISLAPYFLPILKKSIVINLANYSFFVKLAKVLKLKKFLLITITPETIAIVITALAIGIALFAFVRGLRHLTTTYHVDQVSLNYSHGLIGRKRDNIDLVVITDQQVSANPLDLLLGLENIKIISTDKTDREYTIRSVDKETAKSVADFLRIFSNNNLTSREQAKDVLKAKTRQ